ncbi:hypothetical protein OIU74_011421 [Salix koriyanagi]|uniref:Uncharacterized protein n=1 Tax=Salix koriyanagi TaxID=2511006 RepID=A0A9Q0YUK4_9ROSI|nr:hypothetical protein OIU74_011421 [Salix koriyanagi]
MNKKLNIDEVENFIKGTETSCSPRNVNMVGTLPLLPIKPLAKGLRWDRTQKLKNTPPRSLLHCGNGLYIVLATPTAIAIRFRIIIVVGGTIKKLHLTTYKSANSSSPSSGVAGLYVKVNEMSNPAITFSNPCKTAAGWALVPPITFSNHAHFATSHQV